MASPDEKPRILNGINQAKKKEVLKTQFVKKKKKNKFYIVFENQSDAIFSPFVALGWVGGFKANCPLVGWAYRGRALCGGLSKGS